MDGVQDWEQVEWQSLGVWVASLFAVDAME